MFALWMFGNVIENYWGPRRFLFYYLATGFGAAIIHYIVVYLQMQPTLQVIDSLIAQPSNNDIVSFFNSGKFKIVSQEIANNFNTFRPDYNMLLNNDPQMALSQATAFLSQYRIDFINGHLVVGASGSVYGILLAFGMMFPNALVYLFFAIPIKAKYLVILYGVLELAAGIADRPGSNIAHFAHLGGMIFGLILILYWRKKRRI
jgi:membrane associated rhomboid family serine protease